MKKIESLVEVIFAACFLFAPLLLMIIGIWMIYNVDPLIGLVIGLIGCAGAGFAYPRALEKLRKLRKTIK